MSICIHSHFIVLKTIKDLEKSAEGIICAFHFSAQLLFEKYSFYKICTKIHSRYTQKLMECSLLFTISNQTGMYQQSLVNFHCNGKQQFSRCYMHKGMAKLIGTFLQLCCNVLIVSLIYQLCTKFNPTYFSQRYLRM